MTASHQPNSTLVTTFGRPDPGAGEGGNVAARTILRRSWGDENALAITFYLLFVAGTVYLAVAPALFLNIAASAPTLPVSHQPDTSKNWSTRLGGPVRGLFSWRESRL